MKLHILILGTVAPRHYTHPRFDILRLGHAPEILHATPDKFFSESTFVRYEPIGVIVMDSANWQRFTSDASAWLRALLMNCEIVPDIWRVSNDCAELMPLQR